MRPRFSLRLRLVLLNAMVVVAAGVVLLVIVHNLATSYFDTAMHVQSASQLAMTQDMFDHALWAALIPGILISALLAIALNLVVVSLSLRPLARLRWAARRIADGDRTVRVDLGRGDEIGALTRDFDLMARNLARQEQLRERAAADVAHEVRTPIHNLLGLLDAMRDGVMPADTVNLRRARAEVMRLAALADDLQQLSEADAAEHRLDTRACDLVVLARDTVGSTAAAARERNLSLVVGGETTLVVHADVQSMNRVLANLLSNALRYATPGSAISLRITRHDGWARTTVDNAGPTVPEETLPHLFERFFRADPARDRESGGAGIGLAIVHAIVTAHGGRVGAANLEAGVRVWFDIPAEAAPPHRPRPVPSRVLQAS